jgi:phage tail P2-like protein
MPERLLPFNTSPLEQALEQVVANRLETIPLTIGNLWNPEHCPAHLLPWLAWALSIDAWNSDWPDEIKRAAIAGNIALAAVREALNDIGVDFELEEWFQTGGQPHTFQLLTDAVAHWFSNGRPLDTPLFFHIQELIDPVKPVRSHYTTRIKMGSENRIGLANKASQFSVLRLRLPFLIPLTSALGFVALASSPMPYASGSLTLSNPFGLSLLAPLAFSTPMQAAVNPRVQSTLRFTPQVLPTQILKINVPSRTVTTQKLTITVTL